MVSRNVVLLHLLCKFVVRLQKCINLADCQTIRQVFPLFGIKKLSRSSRLHLSHQHLPHRAVAHTEEVQTTLLAAHPLAAEGVSLRHRSLAIMHKGTIYVCCFIIHFHNVLEKIPCRCGLILFLGALGDVKGGGVVDAKYSTYIEWLLNQRGDAGDATTVIECFKYCESAIYVLNGRKVFLLKLLM